nr:RNA-dependent RNA polymerase [Phomopsis vexans victorivirus 1]
MIPRRVTDRATAAGSVGRYALEQCDERVLNDISGLPYDEQVSYIYRPTWYGRHVSQLVRALTGFLAPDFPVQVPLSQGDILLLLRSTLPSVARRTAHVTPERFLDSKWTTDNFPLKSHPGARNKVNVYLSEVMRDLQRYDATSYRLCATRLAAHAGHIYNDQASAIVLHGFGLQLKGVIDGWDISIGGLLDKEWANGLTLFLKASGGTADPLGACVVEMASLAGRGVGTVDLMSEAHYRCTSGADEKIAHFDESDLRETIRTVLREEIRRENETYACDFDTLDDHWASRWAWAVNGANNSTAAKRYDAAPRPPGMDREHRRAWLERVHDDPRPDWDGTTYVSASEKLENGKTRAIFACDTVNYLAFEHLMKPIERRWRGNRVILDPGRGGHIGMAYAVNAARGRAGVSMMLDYDDFNSQHSTRAQQILIEETCDLAEYPTDLRDKLIASFDKMHVYCRGKEVGIAKGTLMSGHRCTTYINSVLNAVYLRLVLGAHFYDEAVAMHVGDDVYLGVRSYRDAAFVRGAIAASQLRMNPMKQSVGHVSTEFLRNVASGRSIRGYLARAVSGIVSGNWVSDLTLDPSEALTSVLSSAHSINNRASVNTLSLLLESALVRMTKLPTEDHNVLRQLLTGSVALDNGPQFHNGGYYWSTRLVVTAVATDRFGYTPLPQAAAKAYLTRAASTLETDVLSQAGVSVLSQMEEASYRKSLPARYAQFERIRLDPVVRSESIGTAYVEDLTRVRAPYGVLTPYPLLVLARRRLPDWLVRYAVGQVGGNPYARDLNLEAWGEYRHGCIVATPMSYPDASMYGKRTSHSVLAARLNVHV